MYTKLNSDENQKMLAMACFSLTFFSADEVRDELKQWFPEVSPHRVRRIVDKAERINRGIQMRRTQNEQS